MKRRLSFLLLMLLLAGMLSSCGLTVPRPEVKEEKFNYSVTYELNGEVKTVSGVYVCEYAGTSWSLDGGYSRDWNGYIEGGTEDDYVVIGTTNDGGTIILVLYLYPDYFMGEDFVSLYGDPKPYLQIDYPLEGVDGFTFERDEEIIEKNYGAKIVSYEYDKPIENTFGLFK